MPSGLPEVDTMAALGGVMSDYAPVEDATTDEAAAYRNLYVMNVAGMTQVTPRAWVRVVGKASSPPDDPASNVHGAVWGNAVGVKPVVARTGTGVWTITWPTTVVDALNVTHTLALFTGWGNNEGGVAAHISVQLTSANVATVKLFTSGGAANDFVGTTFCIFVR